MGLAPYGDSDINHSLYKNFDKYFYLNKKTGLIEIKNLKDLYFSFQKMLIILGLIKLQHSFKNF